MNTPTQQSCVIPVSAVDMVVLTVFVACPPADGGSSVSQPRIECQHSGLILLVFLTGMLLSWPTRWISSSVPYSAMLQPNIEPLKTP